MPKRKARGTSGPLRKSARHSTGPLTTDLASSTAEEPSSSTTQAKQEDQILNSDSNVLLDHPQSTLVSLSPSISRLSPSTPRLPPHNPSSSAIAPNAGPSSIIDVKPLVTDIDIKPSIATATPYLSKGISLGTSTIDQALQPPAEQAEGSAATNPSKAEAVKMEGDVLVKQEKVEVNQTIATKQNIQAGPSALPALGSMAKSGVNPTKRVRSKKACGESEEKRPAKFRKSCPQNIHDRVDRVMTQRMFMIDRQKPPGVALTETFKVLGSTGNVYTVTIGQQPRCDCPDCRKGNVPCKHIIFVFMKVLKVPVTSISWYQKGLLESELREIFNAAPDAQTGPSAASAKVRNAYLRAIGELSEEQAEEVEQQAKGEGEPGNKRVSAIGEDCPVCFEEMSEDDQSSGRLVFDESLAGCGKPIHKECFNMWAAAAVKTSGNATCVWCRSPWPMVDGASSSKGKGKAGVEYTSGGYMNMADIAGMDRHRDTSTYYWGPMAGRRMWQPRYEDD